METRGSPFPHHPTSRSHDCSRSVRASHETEQQQQQRRQEEQEQESAIAEALRSTACLPLPLTLANSSLFAAFEAASCDDRKRVHESI